MAFPFLGVALASDPTGTAVPSLEKNGPRSPAGRAWLLGCGVLVATFDACGRMRAEVRGEAGRWLTDEIGGSGKRRARLEMLVPDVAVAEEAPSFLEAALPEMGRPGEEIARID